MSADAATAAVTATAVKLGEMYGFFISGASSVGSRDYMAVSMGESINGDELLPTARPRTLPPFEVPVYG